MATVKTGRGRALSLPAGIGIGALTGLAITIAGAMAAGKLLDAEMIEMESVGYAAMVILLLSSYISSQMAWRKVKRQRAAVSLGAGGIYYLLLLAMTALFFGGRYSGMGVTALLVLAGNGSAVLLGLYGRRPGKRNSYPKQLRKIVQTDHR